ncbi:MAG: hypothetical protein Q9228_003308 [Teloschistes exilis]
MKKLFHRRKNSAPSSPEQTPPRTRNPDTINTDPNIRTSRYESTAPAKLPQTGQYPLKGNGSSAALQGRHSETYSRGQASGGPDPSPRPSTSTPYYGSLPAPRVTSASHERPYEFPAVSGYDQRLLNQQGDAPVQDFSRLNLNTSSDQNHDDDFPLRQHKGQNTFSENVHDPGYPPAKQNRRSHGEVSPSRIRMVGGPRPLHQDDGISPQDRDMEAEDLTRYDFSDRGYHHHGPDSSYAPSQQRQKDDGFITRKTPNLQRQDDGYSGQAPITAHQPASSPTFRTDPNRGHMPLPSSQDSYAESRYKTPEEPTYPRSNIPGGNYRGTRNVQLSAQQVVDRARQDTYDTEVVEKVAPAVVHETVHQEVHHIREELITKEIHTHDIYHRILPVIDVEVLPPRHFLPVEGGGLVEISGKEVPGRGKNWVIAETASKIPSDQPAPNQPRVFSAREFPGTEGDAVRYRTREGHERTEETWVHPPTLETGGRDTGQTWPMEFGNEAATKSSRERKSSRSNKSHKHTRKPVENRSTRSTQPAGTDTILRLGLGSPVPVRKILSLLMVCEHSIAGSIATHTRDGEIVWHTAQRQEFAYDIGDGIRIQVMNLSGHVVKWGQLQVVVRGLIQFLVDGNRGYEVMFRFRADGQGEFGWGYLAKGGNRPSQVQDH